MSLRTFVLYIQTGLHLLTANTSSDQSVVDDGISPNSEDKRSKTEVRLTLFVFLMHVLDRIGQYNDLY